MRQKVNKGLSGYLCLGMRLSAALLVSCLALAPSALATGDANTASGETCPNEALSGFRAYLPDCRAYEMVTPVFKDGSELEVDGASEDGSRLIAESLGATAGAESDSESHGAQYELSRSPSGWSVSAISPPASSFPAQALQAASPELDDTLWIARTPTESIAAENLYVREADGSMVEIGPLPPPPATIGPPAGETESFLYRKELEYLSASANFAHVLFEIQVGHETGRLWPGDTTVGKASLYEYTGREQSHPELVGVSDGSDVNEVGGVSKVVPAGTPISACETYLGSHEDLYNAISARGTSVFFTAVGHNDGGCSPATEAPGVSELYARVDQFETVPISEPSHLQCEECRTAVATNKEPATTELPAEFAGASQDGTKVFFLTEQELLAGAGTMNLYEYDFDEPAKAQVMRASIGSSAPEVQGVARVSGDGSHVYFVAGGVLATTGTATTTTGSNELTDVATAGAQPFARGEIVAGAGIPAGATISVVSGQTLQLSADATASATGVTVTVANREGHAPVLHADNLYVYEHDAAYPAGRVSYIAMLCSGEEQSGTLSGVRQCPSFRSDAQDWGPVDARPVQTTPDGRFLVFQSVADLTEGDTSSQPQIFEYDALTEELVRVSTGSIDDEPEGTESANAAESQIPIQGYAEEKVSPAQATTNLIVSGDGSTVVFASNGALTRGATLAAEKSAASVYEYRSTVASGGSISDGNVYLISDGSNSLSASVSGLDASGDDVFFQTADSFVPEDTDTQFDLYDARIDGGFPAPTPLVECVSEACEDPPFVPPASASPGSAGVTLPGSLAPLTSAPVTTAAKGSKKSDTTKAIRAKELASALKACKSKAKRRRCESLARDRYGAGSSPKPGKSSIRHSREGK